MKIDNNVKAQLNGIQAGVGDLVESFNGKVDQLEAHLKSKGIDTNVIRQVKNALTGGAQAACW